MGIVANVKGYINGNEWGVYDSGPSLRSYEELIATEDYQDSLNELNNSPESYYDKLTNEGHIYYNDFVEKYFLASSSGPIMQTWEVGGATGSSICLYYDLQNKIWATDNAYQIPV